VVDGDDGPEARDRVPREVQCLKSGGFHHGEHAVAPLLSVTSSIGAGLASDRPSRYKPAPRLPSHGISARRLDGARPDGYKRAITGGDHEPARTLPCLP